MKKDDLEAMTENEALQLCAEIRRENLAKRYTLAWLQCWGCTTFTRGDPTKMCLRKKEPSG